MSRLIRHAAHLTVGLSCGLVGGLMPAATRGAFILPTSHTAVTAEKTRRGGTFNDFDGRGRQRIGGLLVGNDFTANLGNWPAYEWADWKAGPPTITFQVGAASIIIDQVQTGTKPSREAEITSQPTVAAGAAKSPVIGIEIGDMTRGFLNSNAGSIPEVSLTDTDPGKWVFMGETPSVGIPAAALEARGFVLAGVGCGFVFYFARQ
jgi:hypothetical protein